MAEDWKVSLDALDTTGRDELHTHLIRQEIPMWFSFVRDGETIDPDEVVFLVERRGFNPDEAAKLSRLAAWFNDHAEEIRAARSPAIVGQAQIEGAEAALEKARWERKPTSKGIEEFGYTRGDYPPFKPCEGARIKRDCMDRFLQTPEGREKLHRFFSAYVRDVCQSTVLPLEEFYPALEELARWVGVDPVGILLVITSGYGGFEKSDHPLVVQP